MHALVKFAYNILHFLCRILRQFEVRNGMKRFSVDEDSQLARSLGFIFGMCVILV